MKVIIEGRLYKGIDRSFSPYAQDGYKVIPILNLKKLHNEKFATIYIQFFSIFKRLFFLFSLVYKCIV